MSLQDDHERPETQWDLHRPKGHPRPRESESQRAQLTTSVEHGELKEEKRPISAKLSVPGSGGHADRDYEPGVGGAAQRLLDEDKDLRSYDLRADSGGEGVVRVTGVVDTLQERNRVSEILSSLEGVSRVDNGISISTDGQITDRDVMIEVSEELVDDPRIGMELGIEVSKGHVILTGNVDDEDQRTAAIEAASRARGVTGVTSRLTVGNEPSHEELFHSQVENDRDSQRRRPQ